MNKPMIITLTGVFILFGGVFGWYNLKQHFISKFFATFVPPPKIISTATATSVVWQPVLTAVGTIGSTNGVDISSEVPGQIKTIFFKSGQFVKQGEPLIQLEDVSERAQLADVRAQLQLARSNLLRTKNLYSQKVTTQSALDDASAKVKQLQANYENLDSNISKKLIRAPFDGKIGISQIDLGQYINAGQICASLQAINAYNVKFYLPQEDVRNLTLNQVVKLTADAYPDMVFEGHVSAIDSRIDDNTRTIKVEATIKDTNGKLVPGMFAMVNLNLPPLPNSIVLPQNTINYTLYGESAFVVTLDGKKDTQNRPTGTVKQVFVKTSDKQENRVLITEGISAGDLVVDSGQLKLENGTAVIINNSNPL